MTKAPDEFTARLETVPITKEERLRFLQGMYFGASLTLCGHDRDEIIERLSTVGEAWNITQSEFESTFDELMEQLLAAEREQLMH